MDGATGMTLYFASFTDRAVKATGDMHGCCFGKYFMYPPQPRTCLPRLNNFRKVSYLDLLSCFAVSLMRIIDQINCATK